MRKGRVLKAQPKYSTPEKVAFAVGRTILGALVGGFLFLGSSWVWEWNAYLLLFFTVTGALAALFLGNRFFEWVKDNWWWT